MFELIFKEISAAQIVTALLILAAFIGLAWFSHVASKRVVKKLERATTTRLIEGILTALEKPFIVGIILAGVYLSLLPLPLAVTLRFYFSRGLNTVLSGLGIYIATVFLDVVIRWYEREVVGKRKDVGLTIRILAVFHLAMIIVAILLGIVIALSIWGISSATITGWLGEYGWRIALIIVLSMMVIISIGEWLPQLVVRSLTRGAEESEEEIIKRGETLSRVLTDTGQFFVLFVATFTVLSELRIDITPILAGVGVAGIAIGFGAQSLVKDILGGVFILLENQYRVGDVVKIAGIGGLVESINLRRTVLRDLDAIVHVIPNGQILTVSNYTKGYSRVNLNISVSYGTDLDQAIAIINRVGNELAKDPQWASLILKAPQVLRVDNLGDSGIDIKILGDTKPIRQWDVTGELRKRLKKAFDEEGIEIPWPHTKVYFGNAPPYLNRDQASKGKRHNKTSWKEKGEGYPKFDNTTNE